MEFDALLLSRIQFAFTIAFHIIFPSFTIGLASWLAALEFQWLRTGDPMYRNLFRFWVKIFAVSFGLGVVSGIVMSYQFGTNWSRFSDFTGNVLGPLIAYEVITAFFLEAAFLGIMLFGWERVGDRLHFFATCMVALGTLISAFWILSANSWMQTPAGYAIENGVAVPVNWFEIVFNPSFPLRFAHMVMAAYLTTAFAVAGMSAWMILRAGQVPGLVATPPSDRRLGSPLTLLGPPLRYLHPGSASNGRCYWRGLERQNRSPGHSKEVYDPWIATTVTHLIDDARSWS
ncbi:MAG TPA: cytochrome ubiquinol oxidase subunit I, partial [Beijerinckiaceae bacterium]|nr:cytochrome ubiquinol oxidase subunit I [Beijerinckiaceae bacterium]